MKALVIYETKYGNTEQIARTIAASLNGSISTKVLSVAEATPDGLEDGDLLVVGGPTQAHGATPEFNAMLKRFSVRNLEGVKAATFDTRLHWPQLLSGSAAQTAAHQLQKAGYLMVAPPESFFVSGKEGPLVPGEADRASAWAHHIVEANLEVKKGGEVWIA